MPLCRRGGRLTFLLLRQKQSKQKKRRPYCLRPSAALRATCGARFKWGPARTHFAQTIAGPDPLEAPLLGADRRVLRGAGSNSGSDCSDVGATIFIAEFRKGGCMGGLTLNRSLSEGLGSRATLRECLSTQLDCWRSAAEHRGYCFIGASGGHQLSKDLVVLIDPHHSLERRFTLG